MKNINKMLFVSVLGIASTLYAYEPSVYGAGDINSASPYGLTQTEQAVLENKKTIQMLYNKMNDQQRKIDGLTTIIEGQNREILELKEQLEVTNSSNANSKMDANQTYALLMQLGQTIDQINSNYVSQEDLRIALGGRALNSSNIGEVVQNSNQSNNISDIYREGVQLFSKRSYGAAKEHFEQALTLNYKAASTNYYLGEIAYYTQDFQNAVAYYKESTILYDKASYMDVLYLHTAISLDNNGEREQAKSFYQYVIDNYPNKKSASIARSRM